MTWPPNGLLRFEPGRTVTIHTKDRQTITGRVAYASGERVTLIAASGHYTVWTGAILAYTNH